METAHDRARLEELKREEAEASYDPFNEAENVVRLPLPLVQSSRLFTCSFTPPDYVIDGLLQRRFLYSMTAPTGGGKTAVALLLAAAIARGENISNHEVERGSVLYFAGENPDDIRMRWLAMADKMAFDVDDIDVQFIAGVIPIAEMFDQIKGEIAAEGEVTAVVVDTAAAYFDGDDENDNVQMGKYARTLRRLTTLPGGPSVIVPCHPTKNASNDNLLPRGGGAFIAEMDGNLVCLKKDGVVDLSWHGKFRGPDFPPIGFQILTVACEALKDSKGRLIPTVIAKPLTEAVRTDIETVQRRDEDAVLSVMLLAPGGSLTSMAEALGWNDRNGPAHYRVSRVMKKLEGFKFVTKERDQWVLTEKGKQTARKAK